LLLSGVKYTWSFLLADVSFPILGIDFLREHQLVVDVCGGALIPRASVLAAADCGLFAVFQPPQQSPGPDKPTYAQVASGAAAAVPGGRHGGVGSSEAPLHASGGEQVNTTAVPGGRHGGVGFSEAHLHAARGDQVNRWQDIVKEFPSVVQPLSVSTSPSHGVQHFIQTIGRLTYAKFCRLDPQRLAAAKAEFAKMLAAGVVRRSLSCWSSPLHMVKKKNGTWRPYGDFCRLNLVTTEDKYPLPNMADLSSRLNNCVIFSKLDLQKGYL
jgi:hypothetical protein